MVPAPSTSEPGLLQVKCHVHQGHRALLLIYVVWQFTLNPRPLLVSATAPGRRAITPSLPANPVWLALPSPLSLHGCFPWEVQPCQAVPATTSLPAKAPVLEFEKALAASLTAAIHLFTLCSSQAGPHPFPLEKNPVGAA